MKPTVLLLSAALLALADPPPGRGHGHGHAPHQQQAEREDDQPRAAVSYWRPSDVSVIRQYYTVPNLPPGLQKKLARTGQLPPGWEKCLQPLPVVVEQRLPPLCVSCARGVVDNYAVVYDKRTRVILDVLNLVADLRR